MSGRRHISDDDSSTDGALDRNVDDVGYESDKEGDDDDDDDDDDDEEGDEEDDEEEEGEDEDMDDEEDETDSDTHHGEDYDGDFHLDEEEEEGESEFDDDFDDEGEEEESSGANSEEEYSSVIDSSDGDYEEGYNSDPGDEDDIHRSHDNQFENPLGDFDTELDGDIAGDSDSGLDCPTCHHGSHIDDDDSTDDDGDDNSSEDDDSSDPEDDGRNGVSIVGTADDGDIVMTNSLDDENDITMADDAEDTNDAANDASDAGNIDASNKGDDDPAFRTFNIQEFLDKLLTIDLNNPEEVERFIREALSPHERERLALSAEDEAQILSRLPSNDAAIQEMENNPDIKARVEVHRERLRKLLGCKVQLMLTIGKRDRLPDLMRGWFLLLVANATAECRERIIRLITHPSIQPLPLQYRLGHDHWWPEMLDEVEPKIPLDNPELGGDVFSAYIAIGHDGNRHYAYNGSATAACNTAGLIGEGVRMRTHFSVLAAGHQDIVARRRARKSDGPEVLLVHELLSKCPEHHFTASNRFPADLDDPNHPESAALALIAESLNTLLLSSIAASHTPRTPTGATLQSISMAIAARFRAEASLPASPWDGANVVLQMVQNAPAIWKCLHPQRLEATSTLMNKLEQRFEISEGDPTFAIKECRAMLASENLPETGSYVKTLQGMYADLLKKHGIKYWTEDGLRARRRGILWSAIVPEAEEAGLASCPDGKDCYDFNSGDLDWVRVSQRAESNAAIFGELDQDYSAAGCRQLYRNSKAYIEIMLHKSNWERFRDGVPRPIPRIRRAHYPAPIRKRMNQISQFHVFSHLSAQGLVKTAEGQVLLKVQRVSDEECLRLPIIQQLRQDVGLCTLVQVADSAWGSHELERKIGSCVSKAIESLKAGLTRAEAGIWANLEEVGTGWDEPRERLEVICPDPPQPKSRQAPQPVPPSDPHEEEQFQLLLRKQAYPKRVSEAAHRAILNANSHSTSTPGPKEVPFGLHGPDGKPIGARLFTTPSKPRQSRQGGMRSGNGMKGKCPRCKVRFIVTWLPFHVASCRGRCKPCQVAKKACSRGMGNEKHCMCCKAKGIEDQCTDFSHEHLLTPKPMAKCERCGVMKINIVSHGRECNGRCGNCLRLRIACEGDGPSNTRQHGCRNCREEGWKCENFSHASEKPTRTCPKCGCIGKPKRHEKRCKGRCRQCRDDRVACERGKGDNACQPCKRGGYKCGGFDHERTTMCRKCGNYLQGTLMGKHKKNCRGKCSACRREKRACVRPETSSRDACQGCKDDGEESECDGGWRDYKPRKKQKVVAKRKGGTQKKGGTKK